MAHHLGAPESDLLLSQRCLVNVRVRLRRVANMLVKHQSFSVTDGKRGIQRTDALSLFCGGHFTCFYLGSTAYVTDRMPTIDM